MTLVILPNDEVFGFFGSWDLAGLFVQMLTGQADVS